MHPEISKQKCPTLTQALSFDFDTPNKRELSTKLKNAEYRLSENYIPQSIICRDEQTEIVKNFVKNFVKDGYAKESLYISGCPGIGKTLIVNRVFREYKNSPEVKKAQVKFINLNAMRLKQPKDVYKNLYLQLLNLTSKAVKKVRISPYNAMIKLDSIFRNTDDLDEVDEQIRLMYKIVFIDQIDYLQTKQQDILYNLFDWTQSQQSRFGIISVSNTLDFPDKLKQKIKSRMGNKILCFKPYNDKQLQQIINQRVQQTDVFQKITIKQIIKRIAQTSSDLRKCFQIFRQAIFLHLKDCSSSQKISSIPSSKVSKAYESVYYDYQHEAYKSMPRPYKQVLKQIALHFQRDVRYMTEEALYNKCKINYKLTEYDIKSILIDFSQLGLVEYKFTANTISFKNHKKWVCKLTVQPDKIMSALYNFE